MRGGRWSSRVGLSGAPHHEPRTTNQSCHAIYQIRKRKTETEQKSDRFIIGFFTWLPPADRSCTRSGPRGPLEGGADALGVSR